MLYGNALPGNKPRSGHPAMPAGNYVTLERLLNSPELEGAILSSYVVELPWLIAHLPGVQRGVPVVLIAHQGAGTPAEATSLRCAEYPSMRILLPACAGRGLFHAKFMLLFYRHCIRLVVSSANLTSQDWTGGVEQFLYTETFPNLAAPAGAAAAGAGGFPLAVPPPPGTLCAWGGDLLRVDLAGFLRDLDIPEGVWRKRLDEADMRGAAARLVASIPGTHRDNRYGVRRLAELAAQLQPAQPPGARVTLECVTGSLGALSADFIQQFTQPTEKCLNRGEGAARVSVRAEVLFPPRADVEDSAFGPAAATTICLQRRLFQAPSFRRDVLRRYVSRRVVAGRGLLSHAKILRLRVDLPAPGPEEAARARREATARAVERRLAGGDAPPPAAPRPAVPAGAGRRMFYRGRWVSMDASDVGALYSALGVGVDGAIPVVRRRTNVIESPCVSTPASASVFGPPASVSPFSQIRSDGTRPGEESSQSDEEEADAHGDADAVVDLTDSPPRRAPGKIVGSWQDLLGPVDRKRSAAPPAAFQPAKRSRAALAAGPLASSTAGPAPEAASASLKQAGDDGTDVHPGPVVSSSLWLYVGSHNFTQSAWGACSTSKVTGEVLSTRIVNYELGVLLAGGPALDRALPYESPAPKYDPQDTPWFGLEAGDTSP
ncbi:hypothetical protein H696_04064 [Fonticula alba]|uniref:Tyrosyl-DNA phosphodiesterase 1 n=1 Tax=Fonticula alba TaxID=691883 RepID=A0A058Z6T7_FONAL|nr:hypothetical protein H696_04064 [Fonticula alba]KCV69648.1 hypothetical protein H696_04064 [Fonticula alba]|eukprot:XP_009496213.1 hypothetical protein H696_04064 [Fonticula alba]